jgi:DNA-binding winged helix-turn-helix (wHTH) protein
MSEEVALEQRRGKARLVVLDDDRDVGELVQKWLAEHGMNAVPAASPPSPVDASATPQSADPSGRSDAFAAAPSGPAFQGEPGSEGRIHLGALEIDAARRTVHIDGVEAHLTPTEFRLLRHLAEHPDRLVGHRELLDRVWGPGYEDDIHLLQVTMRSLRAALAVVSDRLITETVYGAGYRMADMSGSTEAERPSLSATSSRPLAAAQSRRRTTSARTTGLPRSARRHTDPEAE